MPKLLLIATAILSVSVSVFAAEQTLKTSTLTSTELREMASQEAIKADSRQATTTATDAQVMNAGILKLEDPGLASRNSLWHWNAGLRVQTLTPRGQQTMNNGQTLDLDNTGQTVLPTLEFGLQRQVKRSESSSYAIGLMAEAGYANQNTQVTYTSGIRPTNTRLSTSTLGGVIQGLARFASMPSVEWQLGWVEGLITTSHSAPDNAVNFTSQGRYHGPRAGVAYWPTASVAVELLGEALTSNVSTESGAVSLGTRVTW